MRSPHKTKGPDAAAEPIAEPIEQFPADESVQVLKCNGIISLDWDGVPIDIDPNQISFDKEGYGGVKVGDFEVEVKKDGPTNFKLLLTSPDGKRVFMEFEGDPLTFQTIVTVGRKRLKSVLTLIAQLQSEEAGEDQEEKTSA